MQRSRIVLLYSVRLSRRTTTRPGSIGPSASARRNTLCTAATNASRSSGVGWSASRGGITPLRTFRKTFDHAPRAASIVVVLEKRLRSSLPSGESASWQAMQYFVTKLKPGLAPCGDCAAVTPPGMSTEASIAKEIRNRVVDTSQSLRLTLARRASEGPDL